MENGDTRDPGAGRGDGALKERIDELELQLRRRGDGLQFLQMMMKTFVSLSLTERAAICETLLSLACSHLEVRRGAFLLRDEVDDVVFAQATFGPGERDALETGAAVALWRFMMDERVAMWMDAEALGARWKEAPAELCDGLAGVTIDIQDRPVGLLVASGKVSGRPFDEADLEFLAAVGGIAALVVKNADAFGAQQELLAQVEQQAEEAQREAEEKELALRELDQQLEVIERQRLAIRELSTPILQVWENVLVLPVVGMVDTRRSLEIMENLLSEVVRQQARYAILDITGVEIVDTQTANYFIKVIRAAELLGTSCMLTGIRPAVAQTLTEIGVDLSAIVTMSNLQSGLEECIRRMRAGHHGGRTMKVR